MVLADPTKNRLLLNKLTVQRNCAKHSAMLSIARNLGPQSHYTSDFAPVSTKNKYIYFCYLWFLPQKPVDTGQKIMV